MGHKVLLADDSITVQKIVKLSLTEEGIEVIALGNGEQAVQQIESLQPDLVMADVFMPGKDGYEVCEFVKSHPQFKHTPVILLVHAFEPFDPERAKKVGADQQLTKPFQSIRTLVTTVRDLLSVSPPVAASVETNRQEAAATVTAVPEAIIPLTPSIPVSSQPEEEFAVVSSLTSTANAAVEPESAFSGMPGSSPSIPSPLPSFDSLSPLSFSEGSLPIPPMGSPVSDEDAKTDFLPPLDLSVFPSTEWQSPAASMAETSTAEMGAAAFSSVSMSSASVAFSEPVDDVLDLSEVLTTDQNGAGATMLSTAVSMSNEMPLLAVLPSVTSASSASADVLSQEAQVDDASFAQSFDVGMGQISLDAPLATEASPSPVQDVKTGNLTPPVTNNVLPISEAVIEEIVNRVIQRLSSQAIQEIAWEVVPEMAELMIRKQLSQHQQLSH